MAAMYTSLFRRSSHIRTKPSRDVLINIFKSSISSDAKRGTGGRSSFSGDVVTIFGATGFYGRYITNRLGQVGSQIIAPYRGDEHDYRHLRLMGDLGQIVFPAYDLRNAESVAKAVEYSNIVINLVGRDYETRNFKFDDVHVTGAKTIAEACKAAGVKRLIHVSSLDASHESPSKWLRSKAAGEDIVRQIFPSATIIRPAATYGPEDRYFNYYASLKSLPMGWIPLLKHGLNTYKYPMSVSDIVRAVVQIIEDPTTSGRIYELIGPKQYQLFDLVEYIYRVIYRPFRPVSVPKPLFRMAAWGMELSPFIPYMTRDILTRLHLSEVPTGSYPGLEDLGITPITVEEGALFVLRRYRGAVHFHKSIDEIEPIGK